MDNILSPEVEEAISDAVAKPEQPSVEDLAAHDYRKLIPKFEELLQPMSRRQQQRVIMALIKFPLEDNQPRFSYPEEQKAFFVGTQIMDCKFVLQKAVMEIMKDSNKVKEINAEIERLKNENMQQQELQSEATTISGKLF